MERLLSSILSSGVSLQINYMRNIKRYVKIFEKTATRHQRRNATLYEPLNGYCMKDKKTPCKQCLQGVLYNFPLLCQGLSSATTTADASSSRAAAVCHTIIEHFYIISPVSRSNIAVCDRLVEFGLKIFLA